MESLNLVSLWKEFFGDSLEEIDYSGRVMKISSDKDSLEYPVICLIRPEYQGGLPVKGNIVICSRITALEKNDTFPTWKANGKTFQAKRVKGTSNSYEIGVFL